MAEPGRRRATPPSVPSEAPPQDRWRGRNPADWMPRDLARPALVLPCGTGKTRVSMRIMPELSEPGDLGVVLVPSIALTAQVRRE